MFGMRAAVLALLAACGSGATDATCTDDSQCNGQVCARDEHCYPASQIQAVLTKWSIRGQMASATTCASTPSFYLEYDATDGTGFGYAPVPCMEGQFNEDKLPAKYAYVSIGPPDTGLFYATMPIDPSGTVSFDLSP